MIDPRVSEKYGQSVLKGTEILISCVGSIGEIALANESDRGSNIARAIARIPLRDDVSRELIASYLQTSKIKHHFAKILRSVNQPTLNLNQISQILVPNVAAAEARLFEKRIRHSREMINLNKIYDRMLASLFASLQYRAFRGQLLLP